MPNQHEWPHGDAPGETGPDYVALVIEWDEIDDNVTQVAERRSRLLAPDLLKKIAVGAGALGALLLAGWGVHRFRHA